jgi:hypothetical protein
MTQRVVYHFTTGDALLMILTMRKLVPIRDQI